MITYFHIVPEEPLATGCWSVGFPRESTGFWEDCLLVLGVLGNCGRSAVGEGKDDGGGFPFSIAGKAPLLQVVGTVIICPGGAPPLAGTAGRLLNS